MCHGAHCSVQMPQALDAFIFLLPVPPPPPLLRFNASLAAPPLGIRKCTQPPQPRGRRATPYTTGPGRRPVVKRTMHTDVIAAHKCAVNPRHTTVMCSMCPPAERAPVLRLRRPQKKGCRRTGPSAAPLPVTRAAADPSASHEGSSRPLCQSRGQQQTPLPVTRAAADPSAGTMPQEVAAVVAPGVAHWAMARPEPCARPPGICRWHGGPAWDPRGLRRCIGWRSVPREPP